MASGPNSPCDAATLPPERPRDDAPARRTAGGWLLLGAVALLGVFYLHVLKTIATPHIDEAYRRTFVTREFGAYPTSPVYEGVNGLAYRVGTRINFDTERTRLLLARFGWTGYDAVGPFLQSFRGRLYFHVTNQEEIAGKPLTLRLIIDCAMPDGAAALLTVSSNSLELGTAACGQGHIEPEFPIPAGHIGVRPYDRVTLTRSPATLTERIATRLGLRLEAVALRAMVITVAP